MPKQSKEIASLLARHGSVQLLTQGFAFLSGILIVRSMDKPEYAGYAICIALLSAVSGIAEGGLNSSLMSIGGQTRGDRSKFSELYASVIRFRLVLGIPIILTGSLGVFAVLHANGFNPGEAGVATVLTALSMWIALNSGTIYTVLRLDYRFKLIRMSNLLAAIIRVALVGAVLLADLSGMQMMLALGLIVMLGTNRVISRMVRRELPRRPPAMNLYGPKFRTAARRVMPMNVAMILSEQSVLVILTIYGATSSIADIQAMARFGAVFVVVNSLLLDLATPYIARIASGRALVTQGLLPILGAYAIVCGAIIGLGWSLSDFLLSILGAPYRGLQDPLIIVLVGLALAQFSHAFGVLNQARGWLKNSWVYMPLISIWLAVAIMTLDLSTTMGAAILMATQPIAEFVTQVVRFTTGNASERRLRRSVIDNDQCRDHVDVKSSESARKF